MRMLFLLGRKAWIPEFIDGAELYMRALAGAGLPAKEYRYLLQFAGNHEKKLEIILAYLDSGTDRSLLPALVNDLAASLNQQVAAKRELRIRDSSDKARRVLLALRPLLENEATMESAARVWDIYISVGDWQKLNPEERRALVEARQGIGRAPAPWALSRTVYALGDPGRDFVLRELARIPADELADAVDTMQLQMPESHRQRLRARARELAATEPGLGQSLESIRGLILPSEPHSLADYTTGKVSSSTREIIHEVLRHMEKSGEANYREGIRLLYAGRILRDVPTGSADSPGQVSFLLRWLANPNSGSLIEGLSRLGAAPAPDLFFYYSLHRQTLSLAERRLLDNRLLEGMHSALQSGSASAHAFAVHFSKNLNLANDETNTRLINYLNREGRAGALLPTLTDQRQILEVLEKRKQDLSSEQVRALTQVPLRRIEDDSVLAARIALLRSSISDEGEANRLVAELEARRLQAGNSTAVAVTAVSNTCANFFGGLFRRNRQP